MKLYKYCVADRIDVLSSGLIRFTTATNLNDPLDVNPIIGRLFSKEYVQKRFVKPKVRSTIDEVFSEQWLWNRISLETQHTIWEDCFRRILSLWVEMGKERIERALNEGLSSVLDHMFSEPDVSIESITAALRTSIGVLSLSDVFDDVTMWSYYADNHAGLVFEFDSLHEFFQPWVWTDKAIFPGIRSVSYSPFRPYVPAVMVAEDTSHDDDSDAVFFTKDIKWGHEREWRLLRPLAAADKVLGDNIHLFNLPASAISGVVFGCRMANCRRDKISRLLRSNHRYAHISLSEAVISRKGYGVTIGSSAD